MVKGELGYKAGCTHSQMSAAAPRQLRAGKSAVQQSNRQLEFGKEEWREKGETARRKSRLPEGAAEQRRQTEGARGTYRKLESDKAASRQ